MHPQTRIILACFSLSASVLRADTPLPVAQRTNGSETIAGLKSLPANLSRSIVTLHRPDGSNAMRGVLVGAPGYFLTKATEVPQTNTLHVTWTDGSRQTARVVQRDSRLDLLLAYAPVNIGRPVTWTSSTALQHGQWLCAPIYGPTQADMTMRLGVFSANRREVRGKGAALGVTMEESPAETAGVRIIEVASDGPAEVAGITQDDLLVTLNGQPIASMDTVKDIISTCQVGQEVSVSIRRNGQLRNLLLRLASKTKVVANWDGEDYGNGGVSLRTDSYPLVIQHDIPLRPTDMGTPLLDVLGNAIGINIARVDRVTTFALPSELFSTTIQEWIAADQHRQAKEPHQVTVRRAIVPGD
jgi:S1-C subfamily serine protease